MPELVLENISKSYGKIQALKCVNLSLRPGIYGLLGPNGAGKSTLMNIITQNINPSSGKIFYNGFPVKRLKASYRSIIGYAPQEQGMYQDFTVERFLSYVAALKGMSDNTFALSLGKLLEALNLKNISKRKIAGLSGGMKQRLLIAQALLNEPKILLLDEPTAGLDPYERIRMRNIIAELSQEKIVLLASHIVSDLEQISSYIVMLKRGELIRFAKPQTLLQELSHMAYEVTIHKDHIDFFKKKYLVSNMQTVEGGVILHILLEKGSRQINGHKLRPRPANLEDVYLYHFSEKSDKGNEPYAGL